MTSPIVLTPKRPSLRENTSCEPFGVRISTAALAGRVIKKHGLEYKKVQKSVIFHLFGEAEAPNEPI